MNSEKLAPGLQEFVKGHNVRKVHKNNKEYLVFYKAVTYNFGSWFASRRGEKFSYGAYKPGNIVKCRKWNSDRNESCSCGLHIGLFDFATNFTDPFNVSFVIEVYVEAKDVVCVPHYYGKLRCKKLYVNRLLGKLIKIGSGPYSLSSRSWWKRMLPNGHWSSGLSKNPEILLK